MKRIKIAPALICIGLIASVPISVLAADDPKSAKASVVAEKSVTVESVDVPNRLLTVKNKDGELQTIGVDETVRNFEQLKKGDTVSLQYRQAVLASLKPPGEGVKGYETKESMQRSKPGDKPGGSAAREIKTTIKVKSVDTENNTLSFDDPRGLSRTIAVKNPDMRAYLKKLKPGDEVEVTYSEALVVKVAAAKP